MNFLRQYKGLPKQIYVLSFARAIVALGMIFIIPFLSLLLTSKLGFSESQAGTIIFFISVVSILGSVIGGKLADEVGRKKIFLLFSFIIVISMIPAGIFCTDAKIVIFIFVAEFCVFGLMPATSAMILDIADDHNKVECFSLLYLSSNIGSALGPIVSGLLFYRHTEWIFWGISFFFILTSLIIGFGIRDVYRVDKSPNENPFTLTKKTETVVEIERDGDEETVAEKKTILRILRKDPLLILFLFCLAVLTVSYVQLDYLLPLHLSQLFGLDAGSKFSSLIWTINGIICVFFTPMIISFSKKLHPLKNIGIAALFYAAGFFLYSVSTTTYEFAIGVIIWTSGEILISTCAGIYIADQMPETHKGRSMGLYEFTRGFGRCLGPALCGYYLISHSYNQAWQLIAVFCLLTDGILWYLVYRRKKTNPRIT